MELSFAPDVTGSQVRFLYTRPQNQYQLYFCLALPLPTLPTNCSVSIVCLESLRHALYVKRKKNFLGILGLLVKCIS